MGAFGVTLSQWAIQHAPGQRHKIETLVHKHKSKSSYPVKILLADIFIENLKYSQIFNIVEYTSKLNVKTYFHDMKYCKWLVCICYIFFQPESY